MRSLSRRVLGLLACTAVAATTLLAASESAAQTPAQPGFTTPLTAKRKWFVTDSGATTGMCGATGGWAEHIVPFTPPSFCPRTYNEFLYGHEHGSLNQTGFVSKSGLFVGVWDDTGGVWDASDIQLRMDATYLRACNSSGTTVDGPSNVPCDVQPNTANSNYPMGPAVQRGFIDMYIARNPRNDINRKQRNFNQCRGGNCTNGNTTCPAGNSTGDPAIFQATSSTHNIRRWIPSSGSSPTVTAINPIFHATNKSYFAFKSAAGAPVTGTAPQGDECAPLRLRQAREPSVTTVYGTAADGSDSYTYITWIERNLCRYNDSSSECSAVDKAWKVYGARFSHQKIPRQQFDAVEFLEGSQAQGGALNDDPTKNARSPKITMVKNGPNPAEPWIVWEEEDGLGNQHVKVKSWSWATKTWTFQGAGNNIGDSNTCRSGVNASSSTNGVAHVGYTVDIGTAKTSLGERAVVATATKVGSECRIVPRMYPGAPGVWPQIGGTTPAPYPGTNWGFIGDGRHAYEPRIMGAPSGDVYVAWRETKVTCGDIAIAARTSGSGDATDPYHPDQLESWSSELATQNASASEHTEQEETAVAAGQGIGVDQYRWQNFLISLEPQFADEYETERLAGAEAVEQQYMQQGTEGPDDSYSPQVYAEPYTLEAAQQKSDELNSLNADQLESRYQEARQLGRTAEQFVQGSDWPEGEPRPDISGETAPEDSIPAALSSSLLAFAEAELYNPCYYDHYVYVSNAYVGDGTTNHPWKDIFGNLTGAVKEWGGANQRGYRPAFAVIPNTTNTTATAHTTNKIVLAANWNGDMKSVEATVGTFHLPGPSQQQLIGTAMTGSHLQYLDGTPTTPNDTYLHTTQKAQRGGPFVVPAAINQTNSFVTYLGWSQTSNNHRSFDLGFYVVRGAKPCLWCPVDAVKYNVAAAY